MTKKTDKAEKKLIDEALKHEHDWEPITPPDVPNVRKQFRMPDEVPPVVAPAPAVVEAAWQVRINGAHKPDGDVTASPSDQARLRRRHG